jgi:hypothetical protein
LVEGLLARADDVAVEYQTEFDGRREESATSRDSRIIEARGIPAGEG